MYESYINSQNTQRKIIYIISETCYIVKKKKIINARAGYEQCSHETFLVLHFDWPFMTYFQMNSHTLGKILFDNIYSYESGKMANRTQQSYMVLRTHQQTNESAKYLCSTPVLTVMVTVVFRTKFIHQKYDQYVVIAGNALFTTHKLCNYSTKANRRPNLWRNFQEQQCLH